MGGKPDAIAPRVTHGNTRFLPLNRKTGSPQAREIFFDCLGPTPAFRCCLYTCGIPSADDAHIRYERQVKESSGRAMSMAACLASRLITNYRDTRGSRHGCSSLLS